MSIAIRDADLDDAADAAAIVDLVDCTLGAAPAARFLVKPLANGERPA